MDEPQPKSRESDAEKLVRQLDMELAMQRTSRGSRSDNRATIRVLSIVFVLVFILGLLGGLYYFAKQLPVPVRETGSPVPEARGE